MDLYNHFVNKSNPNLADISLKPIVELSDFNLADIVNELQIKHFRSIFRENQLPVQPNHFEIGIIDHNDKRKPGTDWVAYVLYPGCIVYFDPHVFLPWIGEGFLKYISKLNFSGFVSYSKLPMLGLLKTRMGRSP